MADNRNFFQRLFNISAPEDPEQKAVGSNMVGYFGVGSEEPRNYKYQDLAKEGYLKNAIVYRCVNEISKGAAAVPNAIMAVEYVTRWRPRMKGALQAITVAALECTICTRWAPGL